jgi:hypothetical protein
VPHMHHKPMREPTTFDVDPSRYQCLALPPTSSTRGQLLRRFLKSGDPRSKRCPWPSRPSSQIGADTAVAGMVRSQSRNGTGRACQGTFAKSRTKNEYPSTTARLILNSKNIQNSC